MAEKQTAPPAPPAQPVAAEPMSADLKAAIETTVREAVKSALQDMVGEIAVAEIVGDDVEDREKRTIRHALFTYALPGGGEAIATRGHTVELGQADIERGERFGAFTDKVGEKPEPEGSTLPPFPVEGSEAEADAWVVAGTVDEIVKAVNEDPSIAGAVLAAEQRRKDDARSTLLAAVATVAGRG